MKRILKQHPMKTPTYISAICFALCSLSLINHAFAASALTFNANADGFVYEGGSPGSTRGWEFDVLAPGGIAITDLGVFDGGAAGLYTSHAVGIWNSFGNLLVSATVPAGTAAPLDPNNLFRIVGTPNVVLPQGTGYRIAAYYESDPPDFDPLQTVASNFDVDPSIAFVNSCYQANVATLTYPTQTASFENPGFFGPSFDFVVVPEPSAMTLVLASVVLGIRRCRMRA
jgi:hypothetical protein